MTKLTTCKTKHRPIIILALCAAAMVAMYCVQFEFNNPVDPANSGRNPPPVGCTQWSGWQTTTAATCTGPGIQTNTCVVGTGDPLTQSLPQLSPTDPACLSSDIDMVFVEGDTFTMGCTDEQGSDCWSNESPSYQVTLSSFSIGKYPVTQAQWVAVMGSNPSHFTGNLSLPIESVSWNDVQTFVSTLNSRTGRQYRLPTEAEWEYAARGGRHSGGFKYAGSNKIGDVAWYGANSSQTRPVGTKAPNELGIYDMSGNVWEWVNDWYWAYTAPAKTNPTGPATGSNRVIRGGSWADDARGCRVSIRDYIAPDFRHFNFGFRLVLSP